MLYAEPTYVRRKSATPGDPRFGELWGLSNTGPSGGTAGTDIKAAQAWDTTTGSRNVVVAVVDEGIDVSHEDLQANIWHNPGEVPGNHADDDGNGYVDDYNGFDFFHNGGTLTTVMNRYSLTQITTPDPAAPEGTTKVTLTTDARLARLNDNSLTPGRRCCGR